MKHAFPIAIIAACALASAAHAQTVTVNTLFDVSDFGGSHMVADLPGPDGKVSFREAVTATNNNTGPQTIEFAIPQNEWWFSDEMAVLRLEDGVFIVTDNETTFDFSTQTDFTGDTNPNGREVGIYGLEVNGLGAPAILVLSDDCVFRGLGIVWQRAQALSIRGSRNRIVECVTGEIEINPYPDHCAFNVIGGTEPTDGNELESIQLACGADDNLIIGNIITTIFVGASANCDTSSRNQIGGPTPEERNVINGFGFYSDEGFPLGEGIEVSWATDTLIEGNYIGITADGSARVDQVGPTGVRVNDSDNTTVRNNVVAGLWAPGRNHYEGEFFGQAIHVTATNRDNNNTTLEGNLIGTDATGMNPIITLNGVVVSPYTNRYTARRTRIGGTDPSQANLIAYTERTGVLVTGPITDTEISGNSIVGNGLIGIDLGAFFLMPDGVTLNDLGDGDTEGGNEFQNFPVIASAGATGSSVNIIGALNSHANRDYRIEFFANSACDPSGFGEGEVFLGFATVTTNGSGDSAFNVNLSGTVSAGEFITATATDLSIGATSEFAECVEAADGSCPADFNNDGIVNTLDFLAFLNAFSAGDPAADFNGDGIINTLDFLDFLNAFNTGC